MDRYSLILVTHQSEHTIAACLRSIEISFRGHPYEILVVDAGSSDTTETIVRETSPTARFLSLRNIGFAAAANVGAQYATGDILFFLNPDTVISSSLPESLRTGFSSPRVHVVAPILQDRASTPEQWQNIPFPSFWQWIRSHLFQRESRFLFSPFSVPWVSGGALAIRRTVFEHLGGFVEHFFLYFEDVDLCVRVRKNGGIILLDPTTPVLHTRGQSATIQTRQYAYDRSQLLYLYRQYTRGRVLLLFRILRCLFRWRAFLLFGVGVGAVATAHLLWGWNVLLYEGVLLLASTVCVVVAYSPHAGLLLLFFSLIVGQTLRPTMFGTTFTLTDILLLPVGSGLFLHTLFQRKYMTPLFSIPLFFLGAISLPGTLLLLDRIADGSILPALLYALRLFLLLSFIPLLRRTQCSFSFTYILFLCVGGTLGVLGFLQLWYVPSLPTLHVNWFSTTLLTFSGGGWDPHHNRLFSTWLDPNFLGAFIGMCAVSLLTLLLYGSFPLLRKRKGISSFLFLLCLFFSLILFLTQSRASLLAVVSTSVALLLFSSYRRFLFTAVSIFLLFLLCSPPLQARLFHSPLDDPSFRLRLQSLEQASTLFFAHPLFGIGYNAYGIEQAQDHLLRAGSSHAQNGVDNVVIFALVTIGVWGTCFLLFGITLFLRTFWMTPSLLRILAFSICGVFFFSSQFIQSATYIHLLLPLCLLLGTLPRHTPHASSA